MSAVKPMRGVAPEPSKYPVTFPRLYSHKLDGIRAMQQGGVTLTKSLKPLPNKYTADWVAANLPDGFDGELIVGDPTQEDVYSKTFSGVMTIAGEPDFKFYVFDLTNHKGTAFERQAALFDMVAQLPAHVAEKVVLVVKTLVQNEAELSLLVADSLELGYEGGMSQHVDSPYVHGKCTAKQSYMLKHKPEDDVEGRILEILPAYENLNEAFTNELGNTARSSHAANKVQKAQVGSFRVQPLDGSGVTKVAAGKMKHAERDRVWAEHVADPTKYIGRVLKFRKMAYGDMANDAARHGRWIGWVDETDISIPD